MIVELAGPEAADHGSALHARPRPQQQEAPGYKPGARYSMSCEIAVGSRVAAITEIVGFTGAPMVTPEPYLVGAGRIELPTSWSQTRRPTAGPRPAVSAAARKALPPLVPPFLHPWPGWHNGETLTTPPLS